MLPSGRAATITPVSGDEWISAAAAEVAARAERELEALVAVSSPSGDAHAAEEAAAVVTALLPTEAEIERPACSTPDYAPDLIARVEGRGERRLVLVGHVDTVISHSAHRPLERIGDRLVGPGTIDMKGGVALSLGVMRALAAVVDSFAELTLLLVTDEEWRSRPFAHVERFAGYDGCLCFEGGELTGEGHDGVVVRRKAAGTLHATAHGAAAHSGSAPDSGRNALLALAACAAEVAALHDPAGSARLTAVPTILRSGEAFNVVPDSGELYCDLRADRLDAFEPVLAALPRELGGVRIEAGMARRWPAMDSRAATEGLLEDAGKRLGRPVVGVERGGASDASHLAETIALTVDGLGPIGGGAHTDQEYALAPSLESRAEVALAVAAALLRID